jgi:hypothetical protein
MVVIVAGIVSKYLINNVHTEYDDGTFEWFDTRQLSIVEPAEVTGRVIDIDHNTPPPPESPWRKIGAILRLEVANNFFEQKRGHFKHYFSAGVWILGIKTV